MASFSGDTGEQSVKVFSVKILLPLKVFSLECFPAIQYCMHTHTQCIRALTSVEVQNTRSNNIRSLPHKYMYVPLECCFTTKLKHVIVVGLQSLSSECRRPRVWQGRNRTGLCTQNIADQGKLCAVVNRD